MKMCSMLTKTKKDVSSQETSINAQLLERAGYVNKLMAGVYSYLPLGLRVLTRIENIVRQEMNAIGGQELLMPTLQPREIWDTTGRWDTVDVLYKLKAHDRDLCLGPTHEEVITPLVGNYIQSYKDLPQAAYQIQTKFRNEARPKSGLLRGREFRMKDLYSFHRDEADLNSFYEKAIDAYKRIFERCGLGQLTYLTYASGGVFSKYSHEFQTITSYGEDHIFLCTQCKIAINKEIIEDQNACPSCQSQQLEESKSIEVGNIFKLKTRFTDAFKLSFTDAQGKQQPIVMGCYGIGTSRLVGAIVEVLHDDKGIIWPEEVAPYHVHLISLLKDDARTHADQLYKQLQDHGISVLFDDRPDVQAGAKFADADLLGMPVRIVISTKTMAQNGVEIKYRNATQSNIISQEQLGQKLKNIL